MKNWRQSLAVYQDKRILAVLLLGFASGLPLALTASTLSVWLTEAKVDLATIGLFALVGVPYTFKFLWAPLADSLPPPFGLRRLGRRRGWLIALQIGLMAALFALGQTDPIRYPLYVAVLAVAVSFLSASQDIVIDALRVEILTEEQYGAGAAAVQLGYRIGMLVSGAGALALADQTTWDVVYGIMAVLMLIGTATALACREPARISVTPSNAQGSPIKWFRQTILAPFADFWARHGWVALGILAFILFFKLGDALAGMMSNPFYIQIGFTKSEIAAVAKVFGFAATVLGTFIGGVLAARYGIMKTLAAGGIAQMLSNLMFVAQAQIGPDVGFLTATIGVENLAGGLGSAAFVAYISRLCNLSYTATQYALLSAVATFGRTVVSSSGGVMVEAVGWSQFFLISTAAALPGLALLAWLALRQEAR